MSHPKEPGQHRAQPARPRSTPPGKRRADVQPRHGRIAVFTASATVTAITVLGGFGLLPSGPEDAGAASGAYVPSVVKDKQGKKSNQTKQGRQRQVIPALTVDRRATSPAGNEPALPAGSGSGHRIVFSEGQQRVWLVDGSGDVLRSYLVSGSATDNLDPGTYDVYSRSRWAVGIDNSGTMQYFVRFTQGDAGAAIGFHTIPVDDGAPVQTVDQLGTPLSHGCVRQRTADAIALWDFAPIGTTVVVTA